LIQVLFWTLNQNSLICLCGKIFEIGFEVSLMKGPTELHVAPVVVSKRNFWSESYLRVLHVYFVNLSAFRRFISEAKTQTILKCKIREHLKRYNKIYGLNRSLTVLQADCLVLTTMAKIISGSDEA
jgi:hypothetical protein